MAVDITNHLIPYAQVKRMLEQAWAEGYEAGSDDPLAELEGGFMPGTPRHEYGLKHVDNERVFHMRSLTEAINAWKMQDFPERWQVVERWKSDWSEVE